MASAPIGTRNAALETAPRAAKMTVRDPNGPRWVLIAGYRRLEPENLFGDNHLQFADPRQIWESAGILFTVEDLFSVQVDLQAALAGGGELYGHVPRGFVAVELRRQPRGDREVPSRYAIHDINLYFTVLGSWHIPPSWCGPYVGSLTNRGYARNLPCAAYGRWDNSLQ